MQNGAEQKLHANKLHLFHTKVDTAGVIYNWMKHLVKLNLHLVQLIIIN